MGAVPVCREKLSPILQVWRLWFRTYSYPQNLQNWIQSIYQWRNDPEGAGSHPCPTCMFSPGLCSWWNKQGEVICSIWRQVHSHWYWYRRALFPWLWCVISQELGTKLQAREKDRPTWVSPKLIWVHKNPPFSISFFSFRCYQFLCLKFLK